MAEQPVSSRKGHRMLPEYKLAALAVAAFVVWKAAVRELGDVGLWTTVVPVFVAILFQNRIDCRAFSGRRFTYLSFLR